MTLAAPSPWPRRALYGALVAVAIVLGLGSRRVHGLPPWLAKEPGDVLYATMAYWLARMLSPGRPRMHAAVAATVFCFLIEASQLDHAPWLEAARDNRLGVLVLGRGFHATDLLCYLAGVGLGLLVDRALVARRSK